MPAAPSRARGPRRYGAQVAVVRALMRLPVHAPYTLDDMAKDAAGVLDALGIRRAHVVGASMGGMIAQVLAARHPERVATLTSIMSSSGNPSPRVALGSRRALRVLLRPPTRLDTVEGITEHLMHVFGVIGSPGFRSERSVAARPAREGRAARLRPRGLRAAAARRPRVGRPPGAARAHHRADPGDPRRGRSAGAGRGRHRHRAAHPGGAAEGRSGHGPRLRARAAAGHRGLDRRAHPARADPARSRRHRRAGAVAAATSA